MSVSSSRVLRMAPEITRSHSHGVFLLDGLLWTITYSLPTVLQRHRVRIREKCAKTDHRLNIFLNCSRLSYPQ
jgi:hypothetical protein